MGKYAPPFQQNTTVINLLAEICELVGRVEVTHRNSISIQLRRQNQIRSIHSSLQIEQNTLSLQQVTAILNGKRVLGPPHEIREVQNAADAYALMQSLNPLCEDDLLNAHKLMMNSLVKEAGRFRSGGVGVMAGNQVIHMAPPAHLVPWQIKDLFTWYQKSDLHPLVKNMLTDQAPTKFPSAEQETFRELIKALGTDTLSASQLMTRMGLVLRPHFRKFYLVPALEKGIIERTIPDKPNSPRQRYRIKK